MSSGMCRADRASKGLGRALSVLALTAIALSACGAQAPASISPEARQTPTGLPLPTPVPEVTPFDPKAMDPKPTDPNLPADPTVPKLPMAPDLAEQVRGPWSLTPFPLPQDVIAVIDVACRGEDGFPQGVELQVVDARGMGLIQAYYDRADGFTRTCNDMTVTFDGVIEQGWGTGSDAGEPMPVLDPSEIAAFHHTALGDTPHTASHLGGIAGSSIARVELHRTGEAPIVASLGNGWFAAWVIGDFGRATIHGFDAAGTEVASVEL